MLAHRLEVRVVAGAGLTEDGLDQADVVIVDARHDASAARDLCSGAHARADTPVLLLMSASTLVTVQPGWGADDFVIDSASAGEFEARLRMLTTLGSETGQVSVGPVVIDEHAYAVTVAGVPLHLTYTEFELLKYLVTHPGRVLTREQLLSEVWGYDYYGGTRTVDVHIRRLRAKLGPEHEGHVTTVRNVGYRFSATRGH